MSVLQSAPPPTAARRGRFRVPVLHRNGLPEAPAPFVLRLRARGDQLLVTADGATGRAEAATPLPVVEAVPRDVADGDRRPWKIACRVGERLYGAVFPAPVAELLEASLRQADGAEVPIVLRIDGERLAALPWELLRDPERERFLALSPRTPLSRAPAEPRAAGSGPVERGNLRVTLVAESVEEDALAITNAAGADPRVEVGVADRIASGARPHIVLLTGSDAGETAVPAGTPLVWVAGNGATPPAHPRGERGDLLVPGTMRSEARRTFARTFATALADGRPIDHAVTLARRAVADEHSVVGLDWAEPVLVAEVPSLPLVVPERNAAVAAGAEVAKKTFGWLRDALTGSVSAVLFLIAGLLVYRLGFSTSNEIALDLLSPFELFSTFKGLILALSTYRDRVLLGVDLIALLLTVGVGVLWLRNRRIEPEEQPGWAARLAGPLTGLRALSFLAMATLTIAGAYAYQQYLWRVVLPIPKDALGIAITREAAAASIDEDLAGVLYAQGQTGRIVVRDLPVAFDAGDTEEARALGKRIGAKAVLIYREFDRGAAGKQYGAYVVFTDPDAGLTIGGAQADSKSAGQLAAANTADLVQVREGVEIPALRTDTVAELVAGAAGVIAYDQNDFREAITLFQQALPTDANAPNTGLVNFYLGEALRLDGQLAEAATALERSIAYYESRESAAVPLSAQDELVLVKAYFARGWLASDIDTEGWDEAIGWYEKAVPRHDALLARSGQLDRPVMVRALFARIYTHLVEANRNLDRPEEEQTWAQRAGEELDALAREAPPDDTTLLAQEAGSRFMLGDCTGAQAAVQKILAIDPADPDALLVSGSVSMFQGRLDLATSAWQQALAIRPEDARARESLAILMSYRAFQSGPYVEPDYLERGEQIHREILAVDPANEQAHRRIADSAEMRAQAAMFDRTAQTRGDDLTTSKSQTLWAADPERRAAAAAAWAVAIEERRILATEIHPNDPTAEVVLAETYERRQHVYLKVIGQAVSGAKVDAADLAAAGDAIDADAAEIREWTDRVLAPDSGASSSDRLRAWSALIASTSNQWSVAVVRGDGAAAQALLNERHRLFEAAVVEADATTVSTLDEFDALYGIYGEGRLLALFDKDQATEAVYLRKLLDLVSWQANQQVTVTRLDSTVCGEERERLAGDDARAAGDLTAARTHYEAALADNPDHVSALTGLAAVLVAQGDPDGATANATKATTIEPDDAEGWIALAQARLVAGDADGVDAALARLLDVTSGQPPQERMANLWLAMGALSSVLASHPENAGLVVATVPVFSGAFDAMPAEYAKTFEYPQLYAELGALALHAGDAATAETLLRRSLDLDPHQAAAGADLALAVLAQGRDATAEIEGAIVETRDTLWQWDLTDVTTVPKQLLAVMTSRVNAYLARFPDGAETVRPLREAISAEANRLAGRPS